MDDDLLWFGLGFLLIKAMSEYELEVIPTMERGGADVYDKLHPSERKHKNDLPGKGLTRAQIRGHVDHFGFAQPDVAVAIALAESGGVPNALGDIRDGKPISFGLWQINTRAHPQWSRDELMDPRRNAEAAFALSRGGTDWSHWSTWWLDPVNRIGPGQGRYLRYMPKGGL